jgi:hypothetical protein
MQKFFCSDFLFVGDTVRQKKPFAIAKNSCGSLGSYSRYNHIGNSGLYISSVVDPHP